VREKILRALVERKFIQTVWKKIKNFPNKTWRKIKSIPSLLDKILSFITVKIMALFIPVDDSKIIFLTFRGSYDCNPKWICEEIVRRKLPYRLSWSFRKKTQTGREDYPPEIKLVRLGTLEFYRDLCSAKLIVDNGITTSWQRYRKKKGQYLIETWHGSLGIKKFSKDAVKDKNWVRKAFREGKMTDVCISNSTFEEDRVYREDYWKSSAMWRHGHARNDILFELDKDRVKKIKKKINELYQLEEDAKICLYAPTFRDDGDRRPYEIDYEALAEALTERFGGNWVILTRFHYRLWERFRKAMMNVDSSVRVINVTAYPDIQELAVRTDVAITDYSSWICEYMLTRRPGFLFATDLNSYVTKDRPFFFPLDTLPFPVAEDQEQLFENIRNFDHNKYTCKCDGFLREMGSVDDGHAAERTVDEIERLMGGKVDGYGTFNGGRQWNSDEK